jgi:hypothetical protein
MYLLTWGVVRTASLFSEAENKRKIKQFWDLCNDFKNTFAKKFASLTRNKGKLRQNFIITLVFEKNAIFSAENW